MADSRHEGVAAAIGAHLDDLDNRTRPVGAVLHDMGAELADLWPIDRTIENKNVHVVCTAEDLDFFASGFMSAVRSRGARPFYSCFWNEYRVNDDQGFIPDTSYMVAQYNQKDVPKADELVAVASSFTEYATVASNLSRMMDRLGKVPQPLIFVPATTDEEFKRVYDSFEARGFYPPPFVLPGMPITNYGARRHVDVHGILRRWTVQEYGGYDQAFIPETISSQMPALKHGL
ncbi:hypothetical protein E0H36_18470 [Rhizobium leguminosarum bv. viciae]|uniref:hypothetical protein n=1 Tax=Rhizobium leguminosarum TaxID=384 RepID=UPI00102FAAC3|nr:hypothetical protein [Rhizobium leguminosarum]MBY5485212.1 hypothetical protein [Rhizobium leguminosarum]TAY88143.1 hypothetical protein ELH83_10095 [Rhizobium leguminosarum]TBZ31228.1 hypothetical protein E0H36_18470 [Rhizobium leguminosarum bv. viciae]